MLLVNKVVWFRSRSAHSCKRRWLKISPITLLIIYDIQQLSSNSFMITPFIIFFLLFNFNICSFFPENDTLTQSFEESSTNHECYYQMALILSIFLGFLGVDQFYLGNWTYAFFKLFTFGLFGICYIADIVLLIDQVMQPSKGGFTFPDDIPKLNYTYL